MTSSNYKLNFADRNSDTFNRSKDNLTYSKYRTGHLSPWHDMRSDVNDHLHSQRDHYLHFFQVVSDDVWDFEATGLKPNTRYKVYIGNVDYTQY